MQKIFFQTYIQRAIDWYIFLALILKCNFWHFQCEGKFKQFSLDISDMIRLSNWKTNQFNTIKVYIFEKYSSRAFQWWVAWCWKWALSKVNNNSFPGTDSVVNISETINAREWKKCFSEPTFKSQSIDISINH